MSVQVIEGFENLPASARGCVLAVGNFDGFHLGHREILRTARRLADGAGAPLVVVAFDPPPAALLAPDRPVQVLLPKEVKYRLLGQHGADAVVVIATTREFLHSSPEAFVRDVLVGRFAARHVVEGENFFFGRDRAGDIQTLRRMAKEGGFEVTAVPPVSLKLAGRGRVQVSSSLVRELVLSGDVAAAGRCLGRPYALHGRVVGGERRGRLLPASSPPPTASTPPAPSWEERPIPRRSPSATSPPSARPSGALRPTSSTPPGISMTSPSRWFSFGGCATRSGSPMLSPCAPR